MKRRLINSRPNHSNSIKSIVSYYGALEEAEMAFGMKITTPCHLLAIQSNISIRNGIR
jgi:hypothetical protein